MLKHDSIEDKEEYNFPLTITKPEITINDIGLEAFPYKVSTFSTNYNAGDVGRTNNLKIASGKTNNRVLMPGEVFSLFIPLYSTLIQRFTNKLTCLYRNFSNISIRIQHNTILLCFRQSQISLSLTFRFLWRDL